VKKAIVETKLNLALAALLVQAEILRDIASGKVYPTLYKAEQLNKKAKDEVVRALQAL